MLISCTFVFTHAKSRFSHDMAHMDRWTESRVIFTPQTRRCITDQSAVLSGSSLVAILYAIFEYILYKRTSLFNHFSDNSILQVPENQKN